MALAGERDSMDPFSDEMNMMDELELSDLRVRQAAIDEQETMFNPDKHPKKPCAKEECVTDIDGKETVDIMSDTPPVEWELGVDGTDVDVV